MISEAEKWRTIILPEPNKLRQNRWYFGGLSGSLAVLVTHPLDLLKVLLQTHETKGRLTYCINTVYRSNGLSGFYNGISASLTRQVTSTTTRFGLYEVLKLHFRTDTFPSMAFVAALSGSVAAILGMPVDVVTARMQNDMKLKTEQRRNYRHVFHGLSVTYREGGISSLYAGVVPGVLRGMIMTICPIAVYDYIKRTLLQKHFSYEGVPLHFSSSLLASIISVTLSQPLDVIKTRTMVVSKEKYINAWQVFLATSREGPLAFYKGILPAYVRLGSHLTLLLVLMEQFRLRWGWLPQATLVEGKV